MKHDNWFICLSYPEFDILIPKEDVESSNYFSSEFTEGACIVDWDLLVHKTSDNYVAGKNKTQLKIQGTENIILQTSIIPDLISAKLSDFRLFQDEMGSAFLSRGFIATRFAEDKIQYLIEINKVIKNIPGIKK